MTDKLKELLEPTISEKTNIDGYIIKFKKPGPNISHFLYRELFGKVLITYKNKKKKGKHRIYYPGYLHDIPYVALGGSIFISKEYNIEPIINLLSKYVIDLDIIPKENYPVSKHKYLTGFQKFYKGQRKHNWHKIVCWKRGLDIELVKKYKPNIMDF